MKYKVGDKVRVRKDLEAEILYDGLIFDTSMRRFKGQIVNIVGVNGYYYDIEEDDDRYAWNDEMLEPVEDIIEYKGKKYDVVHFMEETILSNAALYLKEHKEEILDEAEKEYLRNVIKYVIEPTNLKVKHINKCKVYIGNEYFINFRFTNDDGLCLPYFKDKRMYKGMEVNKEYTLEDLNL